MRYFVGIMNTDESLKVDLGCINTYVYFIREFLKMPNMCGWCPGCWTNHRGMGKGTVFALPKDDGLKKTWIKYINRSNIDSPKDVFLCEKYFEKSFIGQNSTRVRLINELNQVPTLYSDTQGCLPLSLIPAVPLQRKSHTDRSFQADKLTEWISAVRLIRTFLTRMKLFLII